MRVGLAGDTFFGSGGSLSYSNFALLTLAAGSGGNTMDVTGQGKGTIT
jgi:hypothetical protein